ncbi:MAG: HEPN domain-containing protein [Cetobacterium sp.]|uniref:HEPN domain-containing protein n=1 Tax=Cetobacterium sp. TaxID=2071632 RepID=UPI003EE6284F
MSIYQTWWSTDETQVKFGLRKGFYEGAIILVEKAIQSQSYAIKDTIYFPINFLYAHSIELYLKELIEKLSGEMQTGHDLRELWEKLIKYFKLFLESTGDNIEEVISQLKVVETESRNLGKNSIAFRYLIDKNGFYFEQSFEGDYKDLKNNMEQCYTLLEGLESFIEYRMDLLQSTFQDY